MDTDTGLLIVLIMIVLVSIPASSAGKLALINRKLDAILDHLEIEFGSELDRQLLELVNAGRKIEAVKIYRKETGVGLKEAKQYVESLQ